MNIEYVEKLADRLNSDREFFLAKNPQFTHLIFHGRGGKASTDYKQFESSQPGFLNILIKQNERSGFYPMIYRFENGIIKEQTLLEMHLSEVGLRWKYEDLLDLSDEEYEARYLRGVSFIDKSNL